MASRSRSFSKLASENGTGAIAAAECAAEASLLPLLAPVSALEAWLCDAAAACGLPDQVGPRDDQEGSASDADDDAAVVYGELSLGALAWALCAHERDVGDSALFVDLGSGTGKAALLAALCPFVAEARGVELLPARAAVAAALADRFVTSPPAGAARDGRAPCRLDLRCASALDADALPRDASFVLLNWLMWPRHTRVALVPALEALRPGAFVATVVAPVPSAAFRLLRARHVACSWGSADLLIHRRMERGAAWQRTRRATDAGHDIDELLPDVAALTSAGVLQALNLQSDAGASSPDDDKCRQKRLLVVGCGASPLAAQLAAQLRDVAVHGTDLDPRCIAEQRRRAASMAVTWQPLFAAADVRDLPLDDAAWRRCGAPEDADPGYNSDSADDETSFVDNDDDDAAEPRLFDAVLDQCTLDALPRHAGGNALLHGALASLSACLVPGGVAALLSQRPPEEAAPLLTAHPGVTWRLRSAAPVVDSPPVAFCCIMEHTGGNETADEALTAAWGSIDDDAASSTPRRCSFAVCGKARAAQRWFECASCVAEAVCAACAATCHAGHALAPAPPPPGGGLERGFCDCGFSGRCTACGVTPLPDDDDGETLP